jgi:lysophospholipase L1-like esterase
MTINSNPIVFTGSSIMALWASLPTFFPDIPLLNTAVSGSHTHEIAARLEELVLVHTPQMVCYYCGSNDINYDASAETIVNNVVQTYQAIRQRLPQTAFVYWSIIEAPQKRDKLSVVRAVNQQLAQRATELDGFHFTDINPAFVDANGQPRLELYEPDELHLTPLGYIALGQQVAPQVLALWGESLL